MSFSQAVNVKSNIIAVSKESNFFVSDYIDVAAIFSLAEELTPDVKSYGFVYNMGEVNSVSIIEYSVITSTGLSAIASPSIRIRISISAVCLPNCL